MEERQLLMGVIQKATTGPPWEVLLDLVGTNDFSAAYP